MSSPVKEKMQASLKERQLATSAHSTFSYSLAPSFCQQMTIMLITSSELLQLKLSLQTLVAWWVPSPNPTTFFWAPIRSFKKKQLTPRIRQFTIMEAIITRKKSTHNEVKSRLVILSFHASACKGIGFPDNQSNILHSFKLCNDYQICICISKIHIASPKLIHFYLTATQLEMERRHTLILLILLTWILFVAFQCNSPLINVQATKSVNFKLRSSQSSSTTWSSKHHAPTWDDMKKSHKTPSGPNPVGNQRPPTRP